MDAKRLPEANGAAGATYKIPAGGGSPILPANLFAESMATDSQGNLYLSLAGGFNNTDGPMQEIPAQGGTPASIGGNDWGGWWGGIGIDGAGDVYATDNSHVEELPVGEATAVILGTGLQAPFGVAVAPAPAAFLTMTQTDNGPWAASLNASLQRFAAGTTGRPGRRPRLATAPQYTITVGNAGTAATSPVTVTDTLPVGVTLSGTPNDGGANAWTCSGSAGATSFSCTSTAAIAGRTGAIPTIGTPIVVPVSIGLGAAVGHNAITNTVYAFGGGDPGHATASTALAAPDSTTIDLPDVAVNVYVANSFGNSVEEISAGSDTPVDLGSFGQPYGVAVDAAGNVYVADTLANAVEKVPAGGGSPITLGSGFSYPYGVAVDLDGNVYVADTGNNAVKEILATGGYSVISTLASGLNYPESVAVDTNFNVFFADTNNSAIKEIPATAPATVVPLASGFYYPEGVAVDGAGNVYVADYRAVKEILAAGGYATVETLASGEFRPVGVAVDGAGTTYFSVDGGGGGGAAGAVWAIPTGGTAPLQFASVSSPAGLAVAPPSLNPSARTGGKGRNAPQDARGRSGP